VALRAIGRGDLETHEAVLPVGPNLLHRPELSVEEALLVVITQADEAIPSNGHRCPAAMELTNAGIQSVPGVMAANEDLIGLEDVVDASIDAAQNAA
jgi:hypothetical protein